MTLYLIMYLWGFGKGGRLSSVGVLHHNILFARLRTHSWVIFGLSLFTCIATNTLINVQVNLSQAALFCRFEGFISFNMIQFSVLC